MANINHDQLFKELLTTFFVEFLELFFPSVLEYLDTDSIQFVDKELFTDVVGGENQNAANLWFYRYLSSSEFRGRSDISI
jgi:hypothetical protein